MPKLPRLAVGPVFHAPRCPQGYGSPVAWALVHLLADQGLEIQTFQSRACFAPCDAARSLTGRGPGYLDTWLMSREQCLDAFSQGASKSDLALIEGGLGAAGQALGQGGQLDLLADWLQAPRVGIVNVEQLPACRLPRRPKVDGLLLEGLADAGQWPVWKTQLETLWGLPVWGGLPVGGQLRAELALRSPCQAPSRELGRELAQRLAPTLDLARLLRVAQSRELPSVRQGRSERPTAATPGLRIAMALDEAFHCYFPATLEMLEAAGAEVVDFSPLHDERLPEGVHLVYLGCGNPEHHAQRLSQNHLMHAALRRHLFDGGRVYAEAGGLAYLCREMCDEADRPWNMVDIWSLRARPQGVAGTPPAVAATLTSDCWLGGTGEQVRGYLNPRWQFSPMDGCTAEALTAEPHLWRRQGAIGSRLHLYFAAQPRAFQHLVERNSLGCTR